MLRLPRDIIDSVFEFLETDETIWIHYYREPDEITIKINKYSTPIQNLNRYVVVSSAWTNHHEQHLCIY